MTIAAVAPTSAPSIPRVDPTAAGQPSNPVGQTFADMLTNGVTATEAKLAQADKLTAQFAVDDSIPLHRVTYALEEARISFELMLQVRNRLLEGAQQLLNMQL